ncbi:tetratricopeptide repeat protein [Methylopila sp. 73B]|uniref:tetratricopeptide repeat protein n=1 Tax=Methylopila sp. 73B TaxID=1120792 RepID=UPI00036ED90B|nr:tetratricopeptide repeat protein [Methylopila sp. 73B]
MTDIFHEVQDDLRRERMKALWDRFGWLVVSVAVLIVVGVGGWRGYEYYQGQQAQAAGDRYQAASRLAADGKTDEARAAFASLAAEGPKGYQALARLREADVATMKDPAGALKIYEGVANDGGVDSLLRDAARVRGAYIAVDHAAAADVRRLVEPLAVDASPWRHTARELIGLAAYKANDAVEARRQFEAIVADAEAPAGARQRADLMLAVLPPAPPAPAAKAAK